MNLNERERFLEMTPDEQTEFLEMFTRNVSKTNEYAQFKMHPSHRPIDERRIKKIEKSFLERPFPYVVIVDKYFQIIDGQSVLEVCKRHGWVVYYYQDKEANYKDIVSLNRETFRFQDFLHLYCNEGYEFYLQISDMGEYHGVTPEIIVHLAKGDRGETENLELFRDGLFDNHNFLQVESFMTKLESFNFCDFYKSAAFIKGLEKVALHPEYNHEIMHRSIQESHDIFKKKYSDKHFYMDALIEMYNNRLPKELMLFFEDNRTPSRNPYAELKELKARIM